MVTTRDASPFDFSPRSTQDAEALNALGFMPGLKELLTLRQVHALEHATVWMLMEAAQAGRLIGHAGNTAEGDRLQLGGMSTEDGFYLYGAVGLADVQRAAGQALRRLQNGEWDLAIHPRCGTNLSVGMAIAVGLALGAHLVMPKDPLGQLVGFGLAATTAMQVAPDVGTVVQRYVTTAIPFNLAIHDIQRLGDRWGQPTHFIRVRWVA
ncbi:MAG TPA: DUF6391 domain-containing protein [Chroococcidiopsis sp.]